jgi:hypothetical protein
MSFANVTVCADAAGHVAPAINNERATRFI